MAQYYVPSRTYAPPSTHQTRDEDYHVLNLSDSSIYIFPSPSSEPASPSQASDISIPTDYALSIISEPCSRESSTHRSGHDRGSDLNLPHTSALTPLTPLLDGDINFDHGWWQNTIDEDSLLVGSEETVERPSRWEFLGRRRPLRRYEFMHSPENQRASLSASNLTTIVKIEKESLDHAPESYAATVTSPLHPRILHPVISFLVSILSVDDETSRLLTHSPSYSSLFPGQTMPSSTESSSTDSYSRSHSIEKLMKEESGSRVLSDGFAVFSDPSLNCEPFFLSPLRLSGLWNLVNGLVSNGSKAIHNVLR